MNCGTSVHKAKLAYTLDRSRPDLAMSDDCRQAATGGPLREVPIEPEDSAAAEHKEWLKEMRGWLIVLATLAAGVTYQAGLNPPGGFWQDNTPPHQAGLNPPGGFWQDNTPPHVAGNPVLRDGEFVKRYLTFYYFNATAFATSLVIILLLLNERFYKSEAKVVALTLTTMVDLVSLVGAYIAGSTRDMPNSIYIIVLTCVLFVATIYMARVLPDLCFIVLFMAPPLFWLAKKGWLPVTTHLKKRVQTAKEWEKLDQKAQDKGPCSCCSCVRPFKYDKEEAGHGAA
ncbi:hypothetical protein ACP4OV_001575 [Aristida adscensionis]